MKALWTSIFVRLSYLLSCSLIGIVLSTERQQAPNQLDCILDDDHPLDVFDSATFNDSSIHYTSVSSVTMISSPVSLDTVAGSSADLPCEFLSDEYSMFENPILWKKRQTHEETSVNIMGNILEPFLSTNRFEVSFQAEPPTYQLLLKITNLTSIDSGNYTCEIRGRRSTVLAIIEHSLSVTAPLQTLQILIEGGTDTTTASPGERDYIFEHNNEPPSESPVQRALLSEDTLTTVRCVGVGGYPAPSMSIYHGESDVTESCQLLRSVRLYGDRGLRIIECKTERSCDRLAFTARDDGQPMRCVVTVPGMASNHTTVIINVIYRPLIECATVSAYLGERNVGLRCEVRARPSVTSLFWVIDHNGTTVVEGQVVNEYWTLVMDRSDGVMETQLFLKQVLSNSFRSYTLIAENSVSAQSTEVQLVQKSRPKASDLNLSERTPRGGQLAHVRNRDIIDPPENSIYNSATSIISVTIAYCLIGVRTANHIIPLLTLAASYSRPKTI